MMAHICDYCGKGFSTKQRLNTHIERNVCDRGEKTMKNTETETNDDFKPVYLFDEQKKAAEKEKTVYICGGCGNRNDEKFTKCKKCGAENEF